MKRFASLLKQKLMRGNSFLNSKFLIKKENLENPKMQELDNKFDLRKLYRSDHYKKTLKLLEQKKSFIIMSESYDDLFFYFLNTSEKIGEFEKKLKEFEQNGTEQTQNEPNKQINCYEEEEEQSEHQEQRKAHINLDNVFYNTIYLGLTKNNKKEFEGFLFPKPIYIILYRKNIKLKNEIIKYCLKHHKSYQNVIDSYDTTYTQILEKHNWDLKPSIAYNNYYRLFLKDYIQREKNKKLSELNYLNTNYSDVVVKLDNNGQGKTLVYVGKLFNVYVDDYYTNKSESDNIVSMNIQDCDSSKKTRKEVIYTYNERNHKGRLVTHSENRKNSDNNSNSKKGMKLILRPEKKLNENFTFNQNRYKIKFPIQNSNDSRKSIYSGTFASQEGGGSSFRTKKDWFTERNEKNKYIFNENKKVIIPRCLILNKRNNNNLNNEKHSSLLKSESNEGNNIKKEKSQIQQYQQNTNNQNNNNNNCKNNNYIQILTNSNQINFNSKHNVLTPNRKIPLEKKYNMTNHNSYSCLSKFLLKKKKFLLGSNTNRNDREILNFFKNDSDFYY